MQVSRTNIEKRVEDLNAALQRERMERAVVEGALEAARKDNSRLQSEVAALRSTLRRGLPLERATVAPQTTKRDDGGKEGTARPNEPRETALAVPPGGARHAESKYFVMFRNAGR